MLNLPDYKCFNCPWTGEANDLDHPEDFCQRLDLGEKVIYGQCPRCGAFVQEIEHD